MHWLLTAMDVALGVVWASGGMWQRFTGRSVLGDLSHPRAVPGRPSRYFFDQGRWMLGLGAVWLFTAAFRAGDDPFEIRVLADGFALAAAALAYVPIPFRGHHGDQVAPGDRHRVPPRDTPGDPPG